MTPQTIRLLLDRLHLLEAKEAGCWDSRSGAGLRAHRIRVAEIAALRHDLERAGVSPDAPAPRVVVFS